MSNSVVIEWAPFRTAPGVNEQELLEASSQLQEHFLARQPGFLRRELLRGKDGAWADIIHWRDRGAADRAMQAALESPVCLTYFKLMADAEQAAATMLHFERAAAYEAPAGGRSG